MLYSFYIIGGKNIDKMPRNFVKKGSHRNYPTSNMERAIDMIESGNQTVYTASKEVGVSTGILRRRIMNHSNTLLTRLGENQFYPSSKKISW